MIQQRAATVAHHLTLKVNEMKIEAGKYYKTRDGRKIGPMQLVSDHATCEGSHWWRNGSVNSTMSTNSDLISEWLPWKTIDYNSPIRTVTRREIVPGVYGRLHVSRDFSMGDKDLRITLSDSQGEADPVGHYWNLDELDEVIHTLSQIREVIAEENGK